MKRCLLLVLLGLTAALGGPGLPLCWAEPLTFSALGCGPYKPQEDAILEQQVKLASEDGRSEFLIHLGDIVSGTKKKWPESEYIKIAKILKTSRIPVFIVPGD